MKQDTFGATWISHTSIRDFLSCPYAYYLHNVYKDPKTKNKINIISPSLSLGQSVHEVLESLIEHPAEERLTVPLLENYEKVWEKISGEKGGFGSKSEEEEYKQRGREMIKRVIENPGPLKNKALKLHSPDSLPPRFFLSLPENILLCGKVDWLEYIEETNSVHIIDFKTGKKEEDPESLQLAIYCLLVQNLQKRNIEKVSYWYLDKENSPVEMQLPDYGKAKEKLMDIGLKIKDARATKRFDCIKNGCYSCRQYEAIIKGEAKYVGSTGYQDLYVV